MWQLSENRQRRTFGICLSRFIHGESILEAVGADQVLIKCCLRGLVGLSLSVLIGEANSLNSVKYVTGNLSIGKPWRAKVLAEAVTDATNHIFVSQLVVELPVLAHLPPGFVAPGFAASSFPLDLPTVKMNLPIAKRNPIAAMPAVTESSTAEALKQYLLVCHARSLSMTTGVWCFTLESIAGEPILDAECEEEGDLNRLSLLAAVRGLESIDGRGMVSLISNNRYLIRSLERSLPRWRENDFVWEQFGRRMAVQNADLWKRIDRTLAIHCVTASLLQSTRVSTSESRLDSPLPAPPRCDVRLDDDSPLLRFDVPHGASAAGPSDGLRRWLAGNCDAAPVATRRGRYRAADLADA